MKEQHIQKSIIDYLQLKKCLVFKHHSTGFTTKGGKTVFIYSNKGISDIIGCMPNGRFLAIEVKQKGNKTTEAQEHFLKEVNLRGGLGLVAYSIDDVSKFI